MRIPVALLLCFCSSLLAEPIPPIERRLPPAGIELEVEAQAELTNRVLALETSLEDCDHPQTRDAGVLVKSVEFALTNGEFYKPQDVDKARRMLDRAEERLARLEGAGPEERIEWGAGLQAHGYRSAIDDSLQPYGLEIPDELDLSQPTPLLIWLHGRGDKSTDLHFLEGCLTRSQAFQGKVPDQSKAVVLHPFGRQCIGFKHAGEVDIFEAIADLRSRYPQVGSEQIILGGFSMGGAGAWHVGAHYTDRFEAIHAGAGFAETAEYNRLAPEDYPVSWEQTLWRVYDAPNYARNFLNIPLIAYSGENDKQKQAADLMKVALQEHGLQLDHRIGAGMEHRYHDEMPMPILNDLLTSPPLAFDEEIHFQTRTLAYNRMGPLKVTGLEEHWQDTRVDGTLEDGVWKLTTENVTALEFASKGEFEIDGVRLSTTEPLQVIRDGNGWKPGSLSGLLKRPGLHGPIDDAFMDSFLVVLPTEQPGNEALADWISFETQHFADRWHELMRGHLPAKAVTELTEDDVRNHNLIVWGTPATNRLIAKVMEGLPLAWDEDSVQLGGQSWASDHHVPALIYPNPLNPERYIVINSGLTFREGHDRTNSLQNPKLPDWAIFDIRQVPDEQSAGKVVAADFFDESWQVK